MKRDCTCPQADHQHGTVRAYVADHCRCWPCQRTGGDHAGWRTGDLHVWYHQSGTPLLPENTMCEQFHPSEVDA